MKPYRPFLLAAALASLLLFPAEGARTLSVTGTGTAGAASGGAEFTVTVESSALTQQDAARDNAARTRQLTEALLRTGAKPEQLATANYTVNPIYTYEGNVRKMEGYRAESQVRVQVPWTSVAGFLIDAAADNGATAIDGLRFLPGESDGPRAEAITAAAEDARRQAEAIAAALGATLGPVLSVSETAPVPAPAYGADRLLTASALSSVTAVEEGQQTVTVQLYVTYALI